MQLAPSRRRALPLPSAAEREIRLGIWKIHVLFHAARREVWGSWLLAELAAHGHALSPGTLYPALARMERNGWLARSGDRAHARARQPLRITPEGQRLLAALRHDVIELYDEVVLGQEVVPGRRSGAERPASRPRREPAAAKRKRPALG
jgi:DNA-binding PadR family transcriptional regulator